MPGRNRLRLAPLVCTMYLVVSGGPYGLEDAVRIAGPRMTLLLCVLVPLSLSLPTALMAAELTALMPLEGGFYFWVKAALGSFAGFAEAYFTTIYTALDTAIYPVLFVTYLSNLYEVGAGAQVALAIVLVWLSGLLNAMGVRPVGNTSMALTAVLLAPFAALVAIGSPRLIHWHLPVETLPRNDLAALGSGLTIVIWNYGGWENLSVITAEIERPESNYLYAVAFAVPAVALGYLLPLAVCLSGPGAVVWHTGSFAEEGRLLSGPILGAAIAIGGAVSSFAVFEAALLWVSRLPFVLAQENYLPKQLTQLSGRSGIPITSLVLCCVVFTLLVPLGFITLVLLDVFFYMGALVLEMWALVRLRRLYPQRGQRFVIRGGNATVYLVALAPILTWVATFGLVASKSAHELLLGLALAAGVWPVYALLRRRYGGPSTMTPLIESTSKYLPQEI
jgi:amino acid transporter